jgi:hypothetical protein
MKETILEDRKNGVYGSISPLVGVANIKFMLPFYDEADDLDSFLARAQEHLKDAVTRLYTRHANSKRAHDDIAG